MTKENIIEFWNLVVDVWKNGVYGVDIGNILTALAIILVFFAIRRLFTNVVIHRLEALAEKTHTDLDDKALEALRPPLRFIPIVIGIFIASQYLNASEAVRDIFESVNRSLISFTIFWALYQLVEPFSFIFTKLRTIFTPSLIDWLIKSVKILFVFLGAATILEIWGIKVGPLIAGLGLFGVAVALGAQDLFKNLIAGLFVIGEKRFVQGDWVKIDGVMEGVVESVGFRTTKIRRFDKSPEYVPNSMLSENVVTNFSEMTYRRINWIIGVEYRTTFDQLKQIRDEIEDYILNTDSFVSPDEASTFVRIDKFNDSSIDILVYCFTKTKVWGEWLEAKETLAYRIKEIVEGAGTGFAFPSKSVYVETLPEKPELFPLHSKSGDNPADDGDEK